MLLKSLVANSNIAPEERLIAALLRNDESASSLSLKDCIADPIAVKKFYKLVLESNVPSLIYERLCRHRLMTALDLITLDDCNSVVTRLRRIAAGREQVYQDFDAHFIELLEILAEFQEGLVWLKGTSLSRTLYADPKQRASGDFDVVVRKSVADAVVRCLVQRGFTPVFDEPGYCHQFGVGPVTDLNELFLVPHADLEGCHNLSLKREGWPDIELKFNPLDTGLNMLELDRFFSDSVNVKWRGRSFLAPHPIDHLMIELVHFHKHGFSGWAWLYDMHLLAGSLSSTEDWNIFVSRCLKEGIESSAWKGLQMTQNLMGTEIPPVVLSRLSQPWLFPLQALAPYWQISSEMIWNANGLLMLLLHALFMGGTKRKLNALVLSFFPDYQFLDRYYGARHRNPINALAAPSPQPQSPYLLLLLLHWLVLVLPGGVVRRTFGPFLWRNNSSSNQSGLETEVRDISGSEVHGSC